MNEQTLTRLWGMRLTFGLVVCIVLFFHLLPLDTTPQRWVGPDLLIGFACAWSVRRPDFVPAVALAGLFLLADLLLQRPPGLWALFALIGCEHLKSRARGLRDSSFASEWMTVCIVIAAITIAYRLGLIITFVPTPPFGLTAFQLMLTLLFYPLVVAITHGLLGVRKLAPGEMDSTGGIA